ISQDRFESEVNSSINDWKSQTINQFLETIKIFQAVSRGNQLMSQQLLYYGYIDSNDRKMNVEVAEYFNCSCTLSSSCLFPIGIIDVSDINSTPTSIIIRVPIFFLGCYPIDGLMKSTLECFYNLSCMLELDIFVLHSPGYSFNFSNLNRNLNLPNETIELIINRLMIDSW
ncbi:unnamed protein product, partial [Rotaria sp. Silwood2]